MFAFASLALSSSIDVAIYIVNHDYLNELFEIPQNELIFCFGKPPWL